jgi:OOP family OmpA-OmpF porin
MKKISVTIACLFAFAFFANAQLPGVLNRAKQRAENKVNDKINKKTDAAVDSVFSQTEKNGQNNATEKNKANEPAIIARDTIPPVSTTPVSIKAYSKYDFVPGEKIIGFEDFSTGSVGDFPEGWNTTGSAEIVTIEGKTGRWLWLTKPGAFVPEFTETYPDDFTFEFDLLHGIPINGAYFNITLAQLVEIGKPQNWTLATNRINFELDNANTGTQTGLSRYSLRKSSISEPSNQSYTDMLNDNHNPVHISIWRQKERVRVYVNEVKLWDIPKALVKEAKLNAIVFDVTYAEAIVQHYIGNLRLAVGAPDTRNKLLTQNKWVTHGILFDVNSANIKPESYGTLKEMANVLKESTDLKIKIVGHTDADGKDADNLDLSKRRAASVKAALANEFGIDESRMQTDGKGESEPIDKANTPAAKANNRRVEFIKI